ncbi:MAG: hypothetical protein AB1733_05850 [Thermodesulfobacteriota bacterium]
MRRLSWNSHALLSLAALRSCEIPELKTPLVVVPLSDFLESAIEEMDHLIDWYRSLLEASTGNTVPHESAAAPITDDEFNRAFQLHPRTKRAYVRLMKPGEVDLPLEHDPSREGPPGGLYVDALPGGTVSAWDVLFTYGDEPDWGMDQDLYVQHGYSYGKAPFGVERGPSSQAQFHMAFFHEHSLIYTLVPVLAKSFVELRCRTFFALADLAFRTGAHYWGWRFTAWAMHYLQDITQPYHARAFPPSVTTVLKRYLSLRISTGLLQVAGDVLKTHHHLFEGFVHFLLNETAKKRSYPELFNALDGSCAKGDEPVHQAMKLASRYAARLAPRVDRMLVKLFGDMTLAQVEWSPASANPSGMAHRFLAVIDEKPDLFDRFVSMVCTCLKETGTMTRYAIAHREHFGSLVSPQFHCSTMSPSNPT